MVGISKIAMYLMKDNSGANIEIEILLNVFTDIRLMFFL